MARDWKARPAPKPTSITEVARRYHAAAVALAQTLGLPLPEVLTQHRESVTAVFIECGRCDLRVPARVQLPPLTAELPANGARRTNLSDDGRGDPHTDETSSAPPVGEPRPRNGTPPLPTAIPSDGDLPCAGQEIATLKPAALAMLIGKVARLAHAEGAGWAPLLHALESERSTRLARGRRPLAVVPPPDGEIAQE
jgi:hypothetical protein